LQVNQLKNISLAKAPKIGAYKLTNSRAPKNISEIIADDIKKYLC
jgi:hypothetical protein